MESAYFFIFFLLDALVTMSVVGVNSFLAPAWALPTRTVLWGRHAVLLLAMGFYADHDFNVGRKRDRSDSAVHRMILFFLFVNFVADAFTFAVQFFLYREMLDVAAWGLDTPDPDRPWLEYAKLGLTAACILVDLIWTWLYAFDVDLLTMARRLWPQFQYAQQHSAPPQASLQQVYTTQQPSYTSVAPSPMLYSQPSPAVATMNVYAAQPAPPPQQMVFQTQPQPQLRSVVVTGPAVNSW
jgi:hypothetical protein